MRIQPGHQGENAHCEQDRGSKSPKKPQFRPESDEEINGNNCPGDEGRGLIQIGHRAMSEVKSTQGHRQSVKAETGQQQKVINPIILAKPATPEEDRVNHTQSVNNNGENKEMLINTWIGAGKPGHEDNIRAEGVKQRSKA